MHVTVLDTESCNNEMDSLDTQIIFLKYKNLARFGYIYVKAKISKGNHKLGKQSSIEIMVTKQQQYNQESVLFRDMKLH